MSDRRKRSDAARGAGRRGGRAGPRGDRSAGRGARRRARQSRGWCSRTGTARASPAPANPGLAGVLVSNGRDVAVTGRGRPLRAAAADEATIFVIKPAGFMPPVDPLTRLPRFYRHHQPNGSPASLNLTFEGLAPTGPMPASLDFALKRRTEPNAFEVVMVTDPQPENEAEVDFIREDLIEALARRDAKFGLTAGDIMFDDLSLYPRLNGIIGSIGLPWWNIGGNHDLNFEAPDRTYSRETYKRVFGPNYYAFFYAQDALPDARRRRLSRARPGEAAGRRQIRGPARRRAARLHPQRARAHAAGDAGRRRHAHSDPHLSRRRALPEPRQQGRAVPAARGPQAYASASPATRTRPSIIISAPPTAGTAPSRTIIMC